MDYLRLSLTTCLAAMLGVSSAVAQNPVPNPNAWVTNRPVNAILHSGDTTYIGGEFTYVGPNTGCGAPLSTATGQPAATYPKVSNGSVRTSVPDGLGGWYIGGDFTQVGGVTRNAIAHILSSGTVDATWNPNASSEYFTCINALAASDDGTTVCAGGFFTSIGGQPRNYIAALDATTGLATDWSPNANSEVFALAVSGTTVYVGGIFTTVGGQWRSCIAALDAATGLATDWNPNSEGRYGPAVYVLVVSEAAVYAGGAFWRIGGQPRNYIAALDATTGLATAWNPDANGDVRALAVSGTTVYAGGEFTSIGGQARNSIAALDATTGLATPWDPNPFDASIHAIAISGSIVYVGGHFTSIGGQTRNHIAALDAATGLATAWNPFPDQPVSTLSVSGTAVYAGGCFASIGMQPRNHIAALDASGVLTSWDPNVNGAYGVSVDALAAAHDATTVYAGGWFSSVGGQPRNCIAALDTITGLATPWSPDANERVHALAVSGTTVYAGGGFSSVGGQPRNCIAALDATTGRATPWNPGANEDVNALAVSGISVYAGGEFTSIGGQSRNHIAALDATTGFATAWDPDADDRVNALALSGATIYAGGTFTAIGGHARKDIAALDTTTGAATAWNPNPSIGAGVPHSVVALAVSDSTVYAGGKFASIGGQTRLGVGALDATTGLATAWDPKACGNYISPISIRAFAISRTTIYVGGDFTIMNGDSQSFYAQFDNAPNAPVASITLDDPSPTALDEVHFGVKFSEPLVNPLTDSDVALTPASLPGSIAVSGVDPDYTVAVTLSDPDADGCVAITIPAGAVSNIDGITYAGGTSAPYLIWNAEVPVTGLAGMAILLGVLTITAARRLRKK